MAIDAVIYRAEPTATEKRSLDLDNVTVLVVNFDNLRQKKIRSVAAFTGSTPQATASWGTVRNDLKQSLVQTGGRYCVGTSVPRAKPFDVRLYVTKHETKEVITNLTKAMAKHKLTLKKVSNA